MEINIEDNIHKLRLRLIDSVIYHDRWQMIRCVWDIFRNSIINVEVLMNISNEHVRRCFSLHEINLTNDFYLLDRIGMDNEPMKNSSDVDRELETHRTQVMTKCLFEEKIRTKICKGTFQSTSSVESTIDDIELFLWFSFAFTTCAWSVRNFILFQSREDRSIVEEQIFISSNIDDLIDSMARRHLAHRRLDVSGQRWTNSVCGKFEF